MMAAELVSTQGQLRASKAELAAQLRDLHRLHALSARLSSHVELSELLQEVLSAVCALQSAPTGLLLLYDTNPPSLRAGAMTGMRDAHLAQLLRRPAPSGPYAAAIADREPVIVEDVGRDRRFPDEAGLAAAGGYQALCCVPLRARTGQIIGLIATFFPEPQRPSARELQLVQLYGGQAAEFIENARHFQTLREASRLKDEFLAALSHEIRTPLNAVLGWTRLLRTTGHLAIDDKGARALEAIERNSRIQAQLVEDLLDISRIVTGKLRLTFEPLPLAEVIEAALDTVRPAADNKQVTLMPILAEGIVVFGDGGRLQQVVWNLLANAVRFTPPEGVITVKLERSATSAIVTVSDTGVGISPEFLPHVFDRFRQDDTPRAQRQKGLGLGLAIVRHLTEAHGGGVEVSSAGRDRGATFTVTLPLGTVGLPVKPLDVPAMATVTPDLAGRHILVVDDEDDSRELLVSALEAYGARTTAVGSGVEALACLQHDFYDALVADIAMVDMNGYALIRAVRALADRGRAPLPALALTVFAHVRDREEALAAGFDRHVAKPVEPERVAAMVEQLIADFQPR